MGFFAGRIGGKKVLSLTSGNNKDINNHLNNGWDTIFHSDMPHVVILETHEVTLWDGGDWYRCSRMPDRVIQLLSAEYDRVVLTEVEFEDGTRRFLYGTSVGIGAKAYNMYRNVSSQPYQTSTVASSKANICASADLHMDVSFYFEETPGTINEKLRDGTGCMYVIGTNSEHGETAPYPIPPKFDPIIRAGWVIHKGAFGGNIIGSVAQPKYPLTIGADAMRHPWMRTTGVNSICLRGETVNRNMYGHSGPRYGRSSNPVGGPYSHNIQTESSGEMSYKAGFFRGPPNSFMGWENTDNNNSGGSWGNNAIYRDNNFRVPRKVRWYVTNMIYNGNGFNVENVFGARNQEIKISPREFIVNGINLMNTGWKFINLNDINYNPGNRPDIRVIASNVARFSGNPTIGNNGYVQFNQPLVRSDNSPEFGQGNVSEMHVTTVGVYNFRSDAQWYVKSNPPEIGNQWGPVWSEGTRPLRLVAGQATADIGGNLRTSGNASHHLANIGLGVNQARGGACVVTLDWKNDEWMGAGGIGCYNPLEDLTQWSEVDSRLRIYGNHFQKRVHQIMCLPINMCVPFHFIRGTVSQLGAGTLSNTNMKAMWAPATSGNATQGDYSITFWLIARSDGNVEVWVNVEMSGIMNMRVILPEVRISLQRLA